MLWLTLLPVMAGDIFIKENPDGTISFSDTPPRDGTWEVFLEEKPMPAPTSVNLVTFPLLDSFDQLILDASKKHGVNASLIKAICVAESGMNPNAVSRAGAQGLMQLMPATASGLSVTDSFDPEQNINGGTLYIKQQLVEFNDTRLALAAYNAGPQNVKKYGGIPPFEETQRYVPRVMALYDFFQTERPIPRATLGPAEGAR